MLTCCRATSSCPPFSRSRLWLPWKSLHRPSEPTANMRLNISSVRQPAQSLPLLPTVVSSYWQAFLASLLPRNHRLTSPLPDNNGRLHSDDPSHEPNMTRSRMVVSPCSYFPSYPSCIDANISRSLQVLMAAVVRSHSIANNPRYESRTLNSHFSPPLPVRSLKISSILTWPFTKVAIDRRSDFSCSLLSTLYCNGTFLLLTLSTSPSSSFCMANASHRHSDNKQRQS